MGVGLGQGGASSDSGREAALAVARALIEKAEADARQARAEADRYVQQREHEAALLVAEARRVLEAAEQEAAGIVAAARGSAIDPPAGPEPAIDLRDGARDDRQEIGRVIAPGATRLTRSAHPSRLDTLLASAIESAVDDTLAGRASA